VPFFIEVNAKPFDSVAACTPLVDHGVTLFADAFMASEGIMLPDHPDQLVRRVVREQYANALAESGQLSKLYAWCTKYVDRQAFECGMQTQTPEDYARCMPTPND
jgi:hypothetical protein